MRIKFIAFLFSITAVVYASPLDTAYDLLDAVTYQDGYALEEIFTSDLYRTFTSFFEQVRALVELDPALAESILYNRYGGRVTISDFQGLSDQEIFGKIMGEICLQPEEQIQQESVNMEGREATVVFLYFNGASISFRMVWENSYWRIADTSLLATLF